jgi:hypothetical protein
MEGFVHLVELRPGFCFGVGVPLGGKLGEHLGVFEAFELFAPRGDGLEKLGALLQDSLRLFAVVPKVLRGGALVELGYASFALGNVKDASRKR